MRSLPSLDVQERRALFLETGAAMGVTPVIIEKDFWVCWTLERLFSIESLPRLLFKGGTSLSKGFEMIERFSEDIDLGMNRTDIGIRANEVPARNMGTKERERARMQLRDAANTYVQQRLLPALLSDFRSELGETFELIASSAGSESVLDFHYPRSLDLAGYPAGAYLAPSVKLELGARSDPTCGQSVEITPYAAKHFPGQFKSPNCTVFAQTPARTLVEKALIVHGWNTKGRASRKSSRHAYDLARMYECGVLNDITRELFESVAEHKYLFADDKAARDAATDGIQVALSEPVRSHIENDYRSMQEMFFSDSASLESVFGALKSIENAINDLKH